MFDKLIHTSDIIRITLIQEKTENRVFGFMRSLKPSKSSTKTHSPQDSPTRMEVKVKLTALFSIL